MGGFPHVFFGTLREHYILLFGAAGSFGLLTGFVGAWIGARLGARAAARRALEGASRELVRSAELKAVTEGMDALLVEVERIAEGQRFVSRVLAERSERGERGERAGALPPAASPRREAGQVTPH